MTHCCRQQPQHRHPCCAAPAANPEEIDLAEDDNESTALAANPEDIDPSTTWYLRVATRQRQQTRCLSRPFAFLFCVALVAGTALTLVKM